jgi:nitrogen PTS system EIIA component
MHLNDILQAGRVSRVAGDTCQRKVFEACANLLSTAQADLDAEDLTDLIIARERLGSTGIGSGVALPHIRHADVTQPVGALLSLQNPIDFNAQDEQPVDLIFALLVPEHQTDQHLALLSELAGFFHQAKYRNALREAADPDALFREFSQACQPKTTHA